MPSVQQPIQLRAPPPRHEIDADLERRRDRPDRPNRQRLDMAMLQPRDQRRGNAGTPRQDALAEASPLAHGLDRCRKPEVGHARTVAAEPSPGRICGQLCGHRDFCRDRGPLGDRRARRTLRPRTNHCPDGPGCGPTTLRSAKFSVHANLAACRRARQQNTCSGDPINRPLSDRLSRYLPTPHPPPRPTLPPTPMHPSTRINPLAHTQRTIRNM
jgi:hypothetical protein